MKAVIELTQDELQELKWNYFYDDEVNHDFDYPHQIPNKTIFKHFAHISFVKEDFSCNV